MLKYSTPELQKALLTLFNLILQTGCSPEIWSQGFYISNLQLCEQ
uniref:Uncharacterized protein n=1 Tax=Anguilla anguilla TaxID=7936 RepID=A0A0E9TCD0_ANGAN